MDLPATEMLNLDRLAPVVVDVQHDFTHDEWGRLLRMPDRRTRQGSATSPSCTSSAAPGCAARRPRGCSWATSTSAAGRATRGYVSPSVARRAGG